MKAVGYTKCLPIDDVEALIDFSIDQPSPRARDLLVRIEAVSVNPVDYKIRQKQPPPADAPGVLGWDGVGEVVETGAKARLFAPGDRVWFAGAIDRPGSNAEFTCVDERLAGRAPAGLAAADAAALPLTALTAHEMLFDRLDVARAVPGGAEAILIIGGSGGVGSIAIQLARALTGLQVIATASRPQTRDWVLAMGAHHVVDHSAPLAAGVAALGIGAPSFVFSTTQSATHAAAAAEILAPQGRYGLIDDPQGFDLKAFKAKSASVHWELMFTRSRFATPDMSRQGEILNELAALVEGGRIRSTAAEHFGAITAANLRRAHTRLESGTAMGKIVLSGFD
ncbi:zinc-binding alcohol dehydrogenase family protein [Ovoidimarina sediminis]|uniref:zinc-binding alcohol dehydrogenase family protein n=1 Tax=Ovoidimarina sediminis TaxID=3079856 RepID=UPI002911617B|nr:zinc-binding alcohol dehydrogenase family protein [Rhodophyticola sp. MJ-SS7]MDU8946601.1 zinc-binding alcohol dehydrogenase family protein [Rhodophyticola sp. MJ-SS7]